MTGIIHSILMDEGSYGIGKTLKELQLSVFDVKINAIKRGHVRGENPSLETKLRLHDHLVLSGSVDDLQKAETYIKSGSRKVKIDAHKAKKKLAKIEKTEN